MSMFGFPIEKGDRFKHSKSGIIYEIVGFGVNAEEDNPPEQEVYIYYKKADDDANFPTIFHRRISNFFALIRANEIDKHATLLRFVTKD